MLPNISRSFEHETGAINKNVVASLVFFIFCKMKLQFMKNIDIERGHVRGVLPSAMQDGGYVHHSLPRKTGSSRCFVCNGGH
jgi:hypothetical protein